MDVLARIFGGGVQANYGPLDDFWYQPIPGPTTFSGMRIDAESAQKVSAYFRGVDILSTALAMLPLQGFKVTEEGRDRLNFTTADVVGRKPNGWQDSFQWRRQQMRHLIHWGNGYNRIVPGSRGFLDQLWPIHPTLVTPRQLDTTRIVYDVRNPTTGATYTYTQDEIFHLRGVSDDGVTGKGVLAYARDAIGLSLAQDSYAAAIFARGAMHGGVIKVDGIMDEDASKRMARSFVNATAGPNNWHWPAVLEQGAEWQPNSMTPENAQMLLSRKFSVNDIARWLGLPPHMLADLERSTNNNIEHQGQEFVTYNLGPWLTLFENAVNDQLIIQTDTYYVEFLRDALVRGDIVARWDAYMKAVTTGTFTRNEVRELENRNKLPGLDKPLDPQNITGAGVGAAAHDQKESASLISPKAEAIVTESAARLLRKEVATVQKLAVRHAAHADQFAAAVTEFYDRHAELVAVTLAWDMDSAREYCASQAAQVLTGDWIAALGTWQTDAYAAGLAALALEEAA